MRLFSYQVLHPDSPWLVPGAVEFLESRLQPHHAGFEWGAGRSKIWFSKRVARITSIEHNEDWYRRVRQLQFALPQNNVNLQLIPVTSTNENEYVDAIKSFDDGTLDFVLVDGFSALRDCCALVAIPKIRVGGLLIVDDVHRYLPSESRAPLALPRDAEPLTHKWNLVRHDLESWEKHLFTSGVTDTGILVRR